MLVCIRASGEQKAKQKYIVSCIWRTCENSSKTCSAAKKCIKHKYQGEGVRGPLSNRKYLR